ncbi:MULTISPECIES: HD-GYP domain-containing protein [Halomonadaceae]|uniref:HD-GYP domain-containing protein n=1 Tax=Modicisalibacter zincidurans TaxID=1178777 RepID=A0ABP9RAF1_9GAMM|nr:MULTISPECIES: HD-GYP domain-containing protein [Halomonas]MCD6009647.1 HD-GYP domain-containing protein [Halomonas sp. IOP_31]
MQELEASERSVEHLCAISVDHLQIGMYVSDLDRPWIETPFLIEGLRLTEADELERLRQLCQRVYVDPQRSTPEVQALLRERAMPLERPGAAVDPRYRVYRVHPIERPAEEELRRVSPAFTEAREMFRRMMHDEQTWHRNIPQVKDTVGRFAESVLANPSALSWLSRIKNENEYTAEHCLNVGVMAMIFGRHLGYDRKQIEELGLAGMLHDVGKMKLNRAILDKPGKLTAAEFAHIRTHALQGYQMLVDDPGIPLAVKNTSRDHHERLDGTGYPYGKRSEEIGLIARIIAIVDTYDAITSDRPYSKARPPSEALRILYKARGDHYDDALVIRFIECIGIYPPGSIVELSNGMVGMVLSVNPDNRLHPRVLVTLDENKQSITETVIDLASDNNQGDEALEIQAVLPPGSYNLSMEKMLLHIV